MEEQIFRSNITSVCLFFKDWRWELMFMKQPDFMLKYSVLVSYITLLCAIIMQAVNSSWVQLDRISFRLQLTNNEFACRQTVAFWALVSVSNVLMLLLLALVWYKKLWIMFISKTEFSRPKQKFSKWLYKLSDRIQRNILVRSSIYLMVIITHSTGIILQLVGIKDRSLKANVILLWYDLVLIHFIFS